MKPISLYEKNHPGDNVSKTIMLTIPDGESAYFENLLKNSDAIQDKERVFFSLISKTYHKTTGNWEYVIQTTSYIGTFVFQDTEIVVHPKFKNAEIVEMMQYGASPDQLFIFHQLANYLTPSLPLIDSLMSYFLTLLKVLISRPLFKDYIYVEEVRGTIKGSVHLIPTLCSDTYHRGLVMCSYDEITQNNAFNQIIKSVIFLLYQSRPENTELLSYLRYFHSIDLCPLSLRLLDSLRYNSLNRHYHPIHNLCRLFIQQSHFGLINGHSSSLCLMFNVEAIYENFVRELFKVYFSPFGYAVSKESYDKGRIQPDVVITRGDEVCLIADAKYKFSYHSTDYRELLDYIITVKTLSESPENRIVYPAENRFGVLVHPKNENMTDHLQLQIDQGECGKYYCYGIDIARISDAAYLHQWFASLFELVNGNISTQYSPFH